ncbi:MAG: hypothetical protein Q7S56_00850 [Nanoarchaeota archaeon]|nr:hypothetical protein [Nanoarchaeota archaeon]
MLRKPGTEVCGNPNAEYILAFTEYKTLRSYKGFVYVDKEKIFEALAKLRSEGMKLFDYNSGEEELAYRSQVVKIRENTTQTPKRGWSICFFTTSAKVLEDLAKELSLPFSKGKVYKANSREEKQNFVFQNQISAFS